MNSQYIMQRNYIKHQLNKSPTKSSYTFAQSPRFTAISNKDQKQSNSLAQSRATSKGRSETNSLAGSKVSEKRLNRANKQINSNQQNQQNQQKQQKSRSRSRSRSIRTQDKMKQLQTEEIISIQKYKTVANDDENLLDNSIDTKKTYATIKTLSNGTRQSRNRIAEVNMNTCQKTGNRMVVKQVSSTKKQPIAYTFSRSPRYAGKSKQREKDIGPGTYTRFSEFGG